MCLSFIGLQAHGLALWMVLVLESERRVGRSAFVHMHGAVLRLCNRPHLFPLIVAVDLVPSRLCDVGPGVLNQEMIKLIRGM